MKKIITFLACFFAINSFAQTLTVDLSQNLNSTFTQSINQQTISKIAIINKVMLSTVNYSVDVEVVRAPIIPLTIPSTTTSGPTGLVGGVCQDLDNAINKLTAETSESNIPGEITSVQSAIKGANATTCAADITTANTAIAATSGVYPVNPGITLKSGDELIITVTRDAKNKWVYDFKVPTENHVIVFYGFTYVPDFLTSFPNYYAQQQGTTGTYLITRMNGNNRNVFQNISPTVMFSYCFYKDADKTVKVALTGGFTYNTQTLGALFGPSLVIGNVISLNTGITFIQKSTLQGQYQPGQVISDNLTFDQLHTKVWTYDIFFSIGFNIPSLFNNKGSATSSTTSTGTNSSSSANP